MKIYLYLIEIMIIIMHYLLIKISVGTPVHFDSVEIGYKNRL